MKAWKWVGLAGIVSAAVIGVAAGTTVAARRRRAWVDADTEELSARLRARLEEAKARQAS